MTRIQETTIYSFEELSDAAKETAREWWRSCENTEMDVDFMFDDFEAIARILGIEFNQGAVPLMNGSTRNRPVIYFSGFCYQGDGACFEGYYSYAKHAPKAIRAYAPQDKTLHALADNLQAIQRPAFYQLSARIKHRGHYYHSGCMSVDVDHERGASSEEEDAIIETMRGFADWMYKQLEAEYEYRMSDENVTDSIICNGYEFTGDGAIA